jgi:hypothetical protein
LHLSARLEKLPKYEGLTKRRPVDVLDCRRGAQWFRLTFDSKSSQAGEPLMKITNWCKKLSAALIAGGLIVPTAATAADLGTNLLANAGFESVNDTGTLGAYNTPQINGWTPSTPDKQGFAYSHNGSMSAGNVVPDYANGAPLASGGNWYFTPNGGPNDAVINGPGQFYQDIDVSAGASGSAIAAGTAAYNISAFFNSYADQGDIGHLHLDFRTNAMTSLGTAEVTGVLPLNEWSQNSRTGAIPVGTHSVRVSIFGTTPVGGGPDGYMDNVVFSVSRIPEPTTVALAGLGFAAGLACGRRRRDD